MKIQITTNTKSVEVANYLLGTITDHLDDNMHMLNKLGISVSDLEQAKKFRRQLVSAFLKQNNPVSITKEN